MQQCRYDQSKRLRRPVPSLSCPARRGVGKIRSGLAIFNATNVATSAAARASSSSVSSQAGALSIYSDPSIGTLVGIASGPDGGTLASDARREARGEFRSTSGDLVMPAVWDEPSGWVSSW